LGSSQLEKDCSNVHDNDVICNHIDGTEIDYLRRIETSFVLTSDSSYQNPNNLNVLYSQGVNLVSGETYDFLIVPVDKFGNSILKMTSIEKQIVEIQGMFKINSAPKQNYYPKILKINIKSTQSTNVDVSNIIDLKSSKMTYDSQDLEVNWVKKDLNDNSFDKLIVRIIYYDVEGSQVNNFEVYILSDGGVVQESNSNSIGINPSGYLVELTNIFPYDSTKTNLNDYGTNDLKVTYP